MFKVISKKITEEHKISFTCSDYALQSLSKVLESCYILGSIGASRSVQFDFDGDGSAKLDNLEVDGISMTDWLKKNNPEFKCDYERDTIIV